MLVHARRLRRSTAPLLAAGCLLCVGFDGCFNVAGGQEILPEPLTLDAALRFAEHQGHPSIALAGARVESAQLELDRAGALNPLSVYLDLVPRTAKRTGNVDNDFFNDSYARLSAGKLLYDFGRTRTLKRIADTELAAQRKLLDLSRQHYKLAVLQLFLDVLLADRRYEIDNEEMTLLFLGYDRLREKRDLFEQTSELDVAQAEAAYREAFARRTDSELQQQYTRLQLALALGTPDDLPRDLVDPDLSGWTERDIPAYDGLVSGALRTNPRLLALRDNLSAAKVQAEKAGLDFGPRLYGAVELNDYATVRASRDDARAALRLQIPLFNGRLKRLDQRQANVELLEAQLEVQELETALRDELFQLVKRLTVLAGERRAASTREHFRELYLDQSRTLYEMEVRTDLGDAQAKLLEADWYTMRAEFSTAVAWATIDMLLGRPFTYPTSAESHDKTQ